MHKPTLDAERATGDLSARFLFISSAWCDGNPLLDYSTMHRCIFHVINLRKMGTTADFVPERDLVPELINNYDAFIFHRPSYDDRIRQFVTQLTVAGKYFCCDYDDMVFDELAIMTSPRRHAGSLSLSELYSAAINNRNAMSLFTSVIVSTNPLAEYAARLAPFRIKVIYNGYLPGWLAHSAESVARRRSNARKTGLKIVSYFSGSSSHDDDFLIIAEPMAAILRSFPDVMLQIVGPLELPAGTMPQEKVIRLNRVPYIDLPQVMASTWLTLAPLNLDRKFNRCKSGLKYFEAGVFGIPCIATLSDDMKRFGDHVVALYDPSDLFSIVERFMCEEYYEKESERIREFTINNCSSLDQTLALAQFVCGRVHT